MLVELGNILKPAINFNSAVKVGVTLTPGVPQTISFTHMSPDGAEFIPTGVIANQQVEISIKELEGFSFITNQEGQNYPAPYNQTLSVMGNGYVELIFVDYPIVLPPVFLVVIPLPEV